MLTRVLVVDWNYEPLVCCKLFAIGRRVHLRCVLLRRVWLRCVLLRWGKPLRLWRRLRDDAPHAVTHGAQIFIEQKINFTQAATLATQDPSEPRVARGHSNGRSCRPRPAHHRYACRHKSCVGSGAAKERVKRRRVRHHRLHGCIARGKHLVAVLARLAILALDASVFALLAKKARRVLER